MKARSRVLVGMGIVTACIAATIVVLDVADRTFTRSMAASYEFKRAHTAPGTVIRFEVPSQSAEQTTSVFTLCFSIDSFSDVPRDLQAEYADAERARVAKEGPRCIAAHDPSGQLKVATGDPIEVVYLLENGGVIDVPRVVIHGKELIARW
jgi:hypothetical protein